MALWFRMENLTPDEYFRQQAKRWHTYAQIRGAYYEGAREAEDAVQATKDLAATKGTA